ncbi:MAG: hypothetical protein M1837_000650 [Sclerophora amabilis]|nr:MAG: hypothetical protein M1837_000650 [Sclerophora amabilis]
MSVRQTLNQREQAKATHYIGLLDSARCNGSWQEVPELIRKVNKHAPQRKCLTLIASSEHQVATYKSRPAAPSTSTSTLAQLIPPLLTAIESENVSQDEAFQARICLGWIHWKLGEPSLALSRLPNDLDQITNESGSSITGSTDWSRVCAIKGMYIRGDSQDKTGSTEDAVDNFAAAVPFISRTTHYQADPESRLWTERLLTRGCVLCAAVARSTRRRSTDSKALLLLRAWSKYWENKPGQGLALLGGSGALSSIPRRQVWKSYYALLSRRLDDGLPHVVLSNQNFSQTTAENENESQGQIASQNSKLQQRAELQRVQAAYESLLLKEVQFPKATQLNEEVEEWVELVISNWRVLCSGAWTDDELGQGGREAVGRGVLDILYRAATKSFHSTAILRHLFAVHTSLAEFDLAFKAFDTYLEIVSKGKARAEKSEEDHSGLDSDELVFWTMTAGINALCRFGARKETERAREVGMLLEDMVAKQNLEKKNWEDSSKNEINFHEPRSTDISSTPETSMAISTAYRAVGVSQAHWARLTYDSSSRADLQIKALTNFQKSLKHGPPNFENLESLFALALLLAERRQLNGAIDVVRQALLPLSQSHLDSLEDGDREGLYETGLLSRDDVFFAKERRLLPLWHLLALLLSATQDFATASKACEAAFEQFRDPINLFGTEEGRTSTSVEHSRATHPTPSFGTENSTSVRGVVDQMEDYEKETILEIKMTQIALLEVSEGPDYAVNATDGLLALYARLFGDPKLADTKSSLKSMNIPQPPKSSSGTIRSIGGSLFGRSKSTRKALNPSSTFVPPNVESAAVSTAGANSIDNELTAAPTIEVTNADDEVADRKPTHHSHLFNHSSSHRGERLVKRSGTIGSKKSSRSLRQKHRADSGAGKNPSSKESSHVNGSTPKHDALGHSHVSGGDNRDRRSTEDHPNAVFTSPSQVGLAMSPDITSPAPSSTGGQYQSPAQPLPPVARNIPRHQAPPPASHPRQPPDQDVRLPSVNRQTLSTQPEPRFPREHQRRRTIGLLIKIWLLIAGLYRRAQVYDDARGAVEEAFKLAEGLEMEASRDSSASRFIDDPGWGGGKSVEELLADVWAERGYLTRATSSHNQALENFEQSLCRFPDHPQATVGLCDILLDISSKSSSTTFNTANVSANDASSSRIHAPTLDPILNGHRRQQQSTPTSQLEHAPGTPSGKPTKSSPSRNSPPELDRLAARDRAYGLLSSLTKLGSGWDYSEAWFALARAYEEGGQTSKTREVLWWCVELEDGRPIRHWKHVGTGGYILQ